MIVGIFLSLFAIIHLNKPKDDHPNKGTILFLGNADMSPIIYNEEGTAKGVAVDIAKEIGNKIGYHVEVTAMDWTEAQEKVLNGEADALLQINSNAERDKLYDFSDELLETDFSLFVTTGNKRIHQLRDLQGKKVGVIKDGYPYEALKKYPEIELVFISSLKDAFLDMRMNDLDVIIVDRWTGEYVLAEEEINDIEIFAAPLESQYSRIAVKKGNTELLNLINEGLEKMHKDGTMENVLNNWGSERVFYFTSEILRNVIIRSLLIIIGIIMLLATYLINKYRKLSQKLERDVAHQTHELLLANVRLQEKNAELKMRATLDGLTEVSNRHGFDAAYAEEWEKSVRNQTSLALIMIDIDHFKCLNDNYGHLVGDEWIKRVAQTIQTFMHKSDHLVARYGGDEIIIVLTDTTEARAAQLAENIRLEVGQLADREMKEDGPSVTVSLGVAATIPNETLKLKELINRADEALYRAKKSGRNKTVVWKSPTKRTLERH